jgi:hydroxypyruvate reductase
VSFPIDFLRRAFVRTLERIDLGARVRDALGNRERPRILAVGKAAPAMLAGALDKTVREILLVVPEGTPLAYVDPRTEVCFADHPLPTERSKGAAERAFVFARPRPMLVLLSGGTSSLLCAPALGLDLDRKRAVTERLLHSGLPIGDLNVVRRHLSRIKGGGLGRACSGAVLTLIASDVLKGGPHDVGSGPTVPDPTTIADARAVLERLHLDAPLSETLKPSDPDAARLEHTIVASPGDLVDAAKAVLEDEGLRVYTLPPTDRDVSELAAAYQGLAQTLSPGEALVRVAEPTVRVTAKEPGRGGRSTHLAALLSTRLPRDCAVLCGASDGVDGTSGAAGAIAFGNAVRGLDVRAAVRAFATADLHRTAGTLVETRGPTGINLCDLHVIARSPK